jgi:transglutaminase-like putative cysteine protease
VTVGLFQSLLPYPSNGHITLAWGRDYGDLSPLHGMIQGGGANDLSASVDVDAIES